MNGVIVDYKTSILQVWVRVYLFIDSFDIVMRTIRYHHTNVITLIGFNGN